MQVLWLPDGSLSCLVQSPFVRPYPVKTAASGPYSGRPPGPCPPPPRWARCPPVPTCAPRRFYENNHWLLISPADHRAVPITSTSLMYCNLINMFCELLTLIGNKYLCLYVLCLYPTLPYPILSIPYRILSYHIVSYFVVQIQGTASI